MSSNNSSAVQNGQPTIGLWSSFSPFLAKPIAASASMAVSFPRFVLKTDKQLTQPSSYKTLCEIAMDKFRGGASQTTATIQPGMKGPMTFREMGLERCKGAAAIGLIVPAQMGLQKLAQQVFFKPKEDERSKSISSDANKAKPKESLSEIVATSAMIGFGTSPGLLIFNGLTNSKGQTLLQSAIKTCKSTSVKQVLAMTGKETAFVAGIAAKDPLSDEVKERLGKERAQKYSKAIDLGSAYISGGIGGLAGHPFDAAITLWQNGRSVHFNNLMRGVVSRVRGVASFVAGFSFLSDALTPKPTISPAGKFEQ